MMTARVSQTAGRLVVAGFSPGPSVLSVHEKFFQLPGGSSEQKTAWNWRAFAMHNVVEHKNTLLENKGKTNLLWKLIALILKWKKSLSGPWWEAFQLNSTYTRTVERGYEGNFCVSINPLVPVGKSSFFLVPGILSALRIPNTGLCILISGFPAWSCSTEADNQEASCCHCGKWHKNQEWFCPWATCIIDC